MENFLWDMWAAFRFMTGLASISAALTFGVAIVCKSFNWSPVTINITVEQTKIPRAAK